MCHNKKRRERQSKKWGRLKRKQYSIHPRFGTALIESHKRSVGSL